MRHWSVWVASLATGLAVATAANADSFLLNYEAPGVQHTTATFSVMGVETFDAQPTGVGPGFSTDYGTSGAIRGTYAGLSSGVEVLPADVFGGAGGSGNYIVAFPDTPYKLTLVMTRSRILMGSTFSGTGSLPSTRATRSPSIRAALKSAP
jgi:hypothetical protein